MSGAPVDTWRSRAAAQRPRKFEIGTEATTASIGTRYVHGRPTRVPSKVMIQLIAAASMARFPRRLPTWLRRLHSEPCRVQRHLAIIGTFEQVSVMSLVIEKGRVAEPGALVFTPLHAAPLLRLRLGRASKSGVEVMHAHCPAAEHLRLLP
jgi:hypothetical protein